MEELNRKEDFTTKMLMLQKKLANSVDFMDIDQDLTTTKSSIALTTTHTAPALTAAAIAPAPAPQPVTAALLQIATPTVSHATTRSTAEEDTTLILHPTQATALILHPTQATALILHITMKENVITRKDQDQDATRSQSENQSGERLERSDQPESLRLTTVTAHQRTIVEKDGEQTMNKLC